MKNSLILLAAGSSSRYHQDVNKVLTKINNVPLYMYSLNTLSCVNFDEYILVCSKDNIEEIKEYLSSTPYNVKLVVGGAERFESVKLGLKKVTGDVVYIHDAARPCVNIDDVKKLIDSSNNYKCGTLCHKVVDTLRNNQDNSLINRNDYLVMTTPQFFRKELFEQILNNQQLITDEISLFEDLDISYILESTPNPKLTYKEDLEYISYLLSTRYHYLVGHSLDYHPFKNDGKLTLGGVIFDDYPSLDGHSNADVVYHAVTESLLGAASLGDLGTLYSDTDPKYKGIDSSILLKDTVSKLKDLHIQIVNIDVMVYLIKPSLKDYKKQMAINIKELTGCDNVCVKAATLNKKGLISLEEGIGAESTCLIRK